MTADDEVRAALPAALGARYERSLTESERHAHGVHFTAERDIADVIGPTITEPWRRRISRAGSAAELRALHAALLEFVVLDPACGSGNFLYAAFVALREIEAELLARLGEDVAGRVRVRQCRGIDRSPAAVELARVALRGATNDEPEIVVGDALFMAWGNVDAIVGNPPFVAKNKLVPELGRAYVERLRAAYPGVSGRADYCVYFIKKAHDSLARGGRAGFVATNTIRQNDSRAGGLGYVVEHGGVLLNAVGTRAWAGDAAVHVSIVNWVKGAVEEPRVLDGKVVGEIGTALSERDLTGARALACNTAPKNFFQGQTHGCRGFLVDPAEAAALGRDERARAWLRPSLTGDELLGVGAPTRFVIDASEVTEVRALQQCPALYRRLAAEVLPEVRRKAEQDPQRRAHAATWWRLWRPRQELVARLRGLQRYIVCARVTRRPIFAFVDAEIRPSDALQAFTLADDYSFGVLQSRLHWEWFVARCSTLKEDHRYTSETVWCSFPWPQAPTPAAVRAVAVAARELRAERAAAVGELGSLRAVYRALERAGAQALGERHARLDAAVRAAYGMSEEADGLTGLLRLNAEVAAAEQAGRRVQAPGLPAELRADEGLYSRDRMACARPWA